MAEYSLRDISDAVVEALINVDFDFSGDLKDAKAKTLLRARTLRERGVIKSTATTQQGKVTAYNEADVAAAVLMISASRSGEALKIMTQIQDDLRPFTNTSRQDAFQHHLSEIKSGEAITISVSIFDRPCPGVEARMGNDPVEVSYSYRVIRYDVTALVRPVLEHLEANAKT